MSFQQVILIGNLGKDPEVRTMTNGGQFCTFSLATSEKWKNQSGDMQESTEWHNITAFGKLGDLCGQYLSKGSEVMIIGKIKTNAWEKDGVKRETKNIQVSEVKFLGKKGTASSSPRSSTQEPEEELPFATADFDSGLPREFTKFVA